MLQGYNMYMRWEVKANRETQKQNFGNKIVIISGNTQKLQIHKLAQNPIYTLFLKQKSKHNIFCNVYY